MKKFLCSLLILSFWALYGMAQYGPGEGGYGGVSLRFQGRLLTQGTCYQPAENILRCQIPEGSPGVLELVAERTPVGPVNVRLVSAPAGWPSFPVTSGWGTVRAPYRFTIPPGTAGSQFELLFEAWTAGIPYPLQLQVILEVVSVQPPTEPEYPPPGYVTDSQGGFSVPVEELPDTVVSGTLTRCGIQPLPGVPVSVELIPKEGRQWIRNLGDIGAVRVSSPGYGEAVVSEFRLLSSMDITGRVQRTIDVGTVCLTPPETTLPFPIPIPSPFVQGPTTEGPAVEIGGEEKEEGGEEGGPQARPTLSILTYNTALLPTLMPKVAERAKIIPKIIAAGNFDIVCLQEVFYEEGKRLMASRWFGKNVGKIKWNGQLKRKRDRLLNLGGIRIKLLGAMPNDEGTEIAVMVENGRYLVAGPDSYCPDPIFGIDVEFTQDGGLMILSKYPIVAASGMIWSNQAGALEEVGSKGVLYAKIKLGQNRYVHIFNAHLAAGNARKIRQQQLEELKRFIKNCIGKDASPVILLGDFNIDGLKKSKESEWWQSLRAFSVNALQLKDLWLELKRRASASESATWVGKNKRLPADSPWGPRNKVAIESGDYQRLDYILFLRGTNPELIPKEISRWPPRPYDFNGLRNYPLSDHVGLRAVFELK